MKTLVVDASVVLAFFLPGESYKAAAMDLLGAFVEERVRLVAPALVDYEVLSGLSKAVLGLRSGRRLSWEDAVAVLEAFGRLGIEKLPVSGTESEILRFSVGEGCSAYDAAYVVLAAQNGWELVTVDERLARGLGGRFPWVRRLEEMVRDL